MEDLELLKKETFLDLLSNPPIYHLLKENVLKDYQEASPGREKEVVALFQDVFKILEENRTDPARLSQALKHIHQKVLKKTDDGFWFNQIYKNYKRSIKPQKRYRQIKDKIKGNKILDIGCGNGLLSQQFHQDGYEVYLTDVLDWRDERSRHLPFTKMTDPSGIPFPDKIGDTALIFAVLHHIEQNNQIKVLNELKRLAHRVIIEEDTYQLPLPRPGLREVIDQDHQLKVFSQLSLSDQFRYLMIIDYFANAITQGIPEMNFPFEFRGVEEWERLFADQGFEVAETIIKGFQKGNFNRSCHVWFVLDVVN